MADFKDAVKIVTVGAVMIAGLIYGGWVAIIIEVIIALVYLICKVI